VFAKLRLKFKLGKEDPDAHAARRLLDLEIIRSRLLERKRKQCDAARRRARPIVMDTRINLWRRRRDWLKDADALAEQTAD
jgi:vacuolar-type H+-ATPase subunit H